MCIYTYEHVTIVMTYTYSLITAVEEQNLLQTTTLTTNVLYYKQAKTKLCLSSSQKNLFSDNLGHVINSHTELCVPNWMRSALINVVMYI